ncbi:zinc finger protein basonuclin-1-like [Scleropages formosus]|uniref:Zinc finger protein basonuclin-1-like n=1 Tax=Scleropages formosus TaxID=113540 RepID=A0A0P7X9C8_SCLFO|nr:zinc finger protein basonuclin-1-like [Scleropages formosus]
MYEIFCTSVNCNCKSFRPGRLRRRQCEICGHGWVAHALSKLRAQPTHHDGQVEVVHCSAAFDICSLMLFGTQAIPVRLKILLDRLFSVLKQEEVIQILTALEWTLQDYVRGYILQVVHLFLERNPCVMFEDPSGKVVDRWVMMTFEEEIATLQQFLRFGETKPIVELMTIQDKEDQAIAVSAACSESVIQAFMENSPPSCPDFTTNARNWTTGAEHHFVDSFKNGASMLPFQFLSYLSTPLLDCTPGIGPYQSEKIQMEEDQIKGCGLMNISTSPFASRIEKSDHTASAKVVADCRPIRDSPSELFSVSATSKLLQVSSEKKTRRLEKSSVNDGSLRKGRVFCSACKKTFYDKGTLKIHYNAVHLKIKHQCTVQGCNMVFSSLRSRNRHSANPNPRLHMPMNRNSRERNTGRCSAMDKVSEGERRPESSMAVSATTDSPGPSYIFRTTNHNLLSQSEMLFSDLKPILPFYCNGLVTPAEFTNVPGTPPSPPVVPLSVPASSAEADMQSSIVPKKNALLVPDPGGHTGDQPETPLPSNDHVESNFQPSAEGLFRILTNYTEAPKACVENCESDQPQLECVCQGDAAEPCNICTKASKSSYSIRMHYHSSHIKEVHLCGADRCNATFLSQRSNHR